MLDGASGRWTAVVWCGWIRQIILPKRHRLALTVHDLTKTGTRRQRDAQKRSRRMYGGGPGSGAVQLTNADPSGWLLEGDASLAV